MGTRAREVVVRCWYCNGNHLSFLRKSPRRGIDCSKLQRNHLPHQVCVCSFTRDQYCEIFNCNQQAMAFLKGACCLYGIINTVLDLKKGGPWLLLDLCKEEDIGLCNWNCCSSFKSKCRNRVGTHPFFISAHRNVNVISESQFSALKSLLIGPIESEDGVSSESKTSDKEDVNVLPAMHL